MKPPPGDIDGAIVVATAALSGRPPTGRTKHVIGEREMSPPAALAFAQYAGVPEVYLFYCDADWNAITDTLHDNLDAAIDQAVFEFGPMEIRECGASGPRRSA